MTFPLCIKSWSWYVCAFIVATGSLIYVLIYKWMFGYSVVLNLNIYLFIFSSLLFYFLFLYHSLSSFHVLTFIYIVNISCMCLYSFIHYVGCAGSVDEGFAWRVRSIHCILSLLTSLVRTYSLPSNIYIYIYCIHMYSVYMYYIPYRYV